MELSVDYLLLVLSVIITTLGLVTLGGIARMFSRNKKSSLKKKIVLFPIFVVGLFLVGWLSERIQTGLYTYLQKNVATSISGIVIAILIAWVLYDWVLFRKKN